MQSIQMKKSTGMVLEQSHQKIPVLKKTRGGLESGRTKGGGGGREVDRRRSSY